MEHSPEVADYFHEVETPPRLDVAAPENAHGLHGWSWCVGGVHVQAGHPRVARGLVNWNSSSPSTHLILWRASPGQLDSGGVWHALGACCGLCGGPVALR